MKYTSKLIEEILKSPSAKRGLNYVTPIYENAYVALSIMQAIGIEIDDIVLWGKQLKEQVIPHTATWSLDYYEQEYGLPILSTNNIQDENKKEKENEVRRQKIINEIRKRVPMNPYIFCDILSLLSKNTVRIKENTGKYKFTVLFNTITYSKENQKVFESKIDTIKPAHLIYSIEYEEKINSDIFIGTFFNNHKHQSLN